MRMGLTNCLPLSKFLHLPLTEVKTVEKELNKISQYRMRQQTSSGNERLEEVVCKKWIRKVAKIFLQQRRHIMNAMLGCQLNAGTTVELLSQLHTHTDRFKATAAIVYYSMYSIVYWLCSRLVVCLNSSTAWLCELNCDRFSVCTDNHNTERALESCSEFGVGQKKRN